MLSQYTPTLITPLITYNTPNQYKFTDTVEPRLSGLAKNGRVNSCHHGHRNVYLLRIRRRPHTLLFISIKWVDQGVVYPFSYLASLWNQGVRIIEVIIGIWQFNSEQAAL